MNPCRHCHLFIVYEVRKSRACKLAFMQRQQPINPGQDRGTMGDDQASTVALPLDQPGQNLALQEGIHVAGGLIQEHERR